MVEPTGYTALDLVGFTDKGTYSSSASYVKNDLVDYGGDKWQCMDDDVSNVTPTEGAYWHKWIDMPDVSGKADISAIGTNETGATASKAYANGEYFYKNGKFCTAIASIASGATFTLGTNYVEGTVAETLGGYKVVCTTTQAKYSDKMQELKTAWDGLTKNDKLKSIIVLLFQGQPAHIHQQMAYGGAFIACGNANGSSNILRFDVCDTANKTYYRVTLNNGSISFDNLTNTSDSSQVYQLLVLN